MPKQQHHPVISRAFSSGAVADIDFQQVSQIDRGVYLDSRNGRTRDIGRKKGIWRKIKGDVLTYNNIDNACTTNSGGSFSISYQCIGFTNFFSMSDRKHHIIEFLADSDGTDPSIIRIDGKVVLRNTDFPISTDFPLQMDVNESCVGGEIYITDHNVAPMVFNLKDLMVNGGLVADEDQGFICTQKYFEDFDIRQNTIGLELPMDHPVFVSLETSAPSGAIIIGTGGLPVGQYQYAIRYVSTTGDRTAWSTSTPLIPVPLTVNAESNNYPHTKTLGAASAVQSAYGIHIRFRVNNELDYDAIEIRRSKFNTGDVLGSTPIEEKLVTTIPIDPGEFSIKNAFDHEDIGTEFTGDDTATEPFQNIEAAKAIRYFNRRLMLMNIRYASQEVEGKIDFLEFDEGTPEASRMVPVVKKLGKNGHNAPFASTYYKSLMRGEKYGHSVVFFDKFGLASFALPIPENTPATHNYQNYEMPNRRVSVSARTQAFSDDPVRAATVVGSVSETHEVFDLKDAVVKTRCDGTDPQTFKNIIDQSANTAGKVWAVVKDGPCPLPTSMRTINLAFPTGGVLTHTVDYQPYYPTRQVNNLNTQSHSYQVNTEVRPTSGGPGGNVPYNPKGFAPNYHAMGMAFAGVRYSTLPGWIQSFSVLRSKAAGRVVAQGLGYYALETGTNTSTNTHKDIKKIWFYGPDVDTNIGVSTMQDVINGFSSGRYKLQLVSPLGFFTEVYDFKNHNLASVRSWRIDAINYARIIRDHESSPEINPDETSNMGLSGGDNYNYVAYGKWRNQLPPGNSHVFTGAGATNPNDTGEQLFDIAAIQTNQHPNRGEYWEITTADNMFNHGTTGGAHDFNEANLQAWHEPMYVVNIIDTAADVADYDIDAFYETGHYQKLNSKVGVSDGSPSQSYLLVDERPEDCCLSNDSITFVTNSLGEDEAWLNVTGITGAPLTAILDDIVAGVRTFSLNGTSYDVVGVYTHTENSLSGLQVEYTLTFDINNNPDPSTYSDNLFIPGTDEIIRVRYNEEKACMVYGGDTYVGEAIFSPLDNEYENGQDPMGGTGSVNDFSINVGFPYRVYEINPRVYLPNNSSGALNMVQDDNTCKFTDSTVHINDGKVRQMACMFTVEARVHMPYLYASEPTPVLHQSNFFPNVHYIMRPHKWDGGSPQNNIFSQYFTDYPNENDAWHSGGFRFLPQINIDYSHEPETRVRVTKPAIGFNEENEYCSRVIWSAVREINVVNHPGVKTFPTLNVFDISDDTGEIKFAWDDTTEKRGSNVYAFTEKGVCMLMVDKRTINELSGGILATVGVSDAQFVQEEHWLTKDVGMDDEMWRSAAFYKDTIYWANHDSVFSMRGQEIKDIARDSLYHTPIYDEFLKDIAGGYSDHVEGVYDTRYQEYWLHLNKPPREFSFSSHFFFDDLGSAVHPNETINLSGNSSPVAYAFLPTGWSAGDSFYVIIGGASSDIMFLGPLIPPPTVYVGSAADKIKFVSLGNDQWDFEVVSSTPQNHKTFAYYPKEGHWEGHYDYRADRFTSFNGFTYGSKNAGEVWKFDEGYLIDSIPISAHVVQVFTPVPEEPRDKEFIYWNVDSNVRPTLVEFFDDFDSYLSGASIASIDGTVTNAIRDRGTFGQYTPREASGPNRRIQGTNLVMKYEHDEASEFEIKKSFMQYKVIN